MSLARSALLKASKSPWLASQMTQRAFARRAVKRFMPGERLSDALDAAQGLVDAQIGTASETAAPTSATFCQAMSDIPVTWMNRLSGPIPM